MNSFTKFLLFATLVLSFSCDNVPTPSQPSKTNEIENDSATISYLDTKRGDTCLLFVHGWNINKSYWEGQSEYFKSKYRIITIDLPGFGQSGKKRKNWTVENYGKDITAVLSSLNVKNVILIGHSMSGAIVVEAALQNPSRVIGVVGVDNFTNVGAVFSEEIKKDIANAYKALRVNYKQIVTQYAEQSLFSPSTNSTIKKRVIHDFTGVDSVAAVDILERNDTYPLDEKLKLLKKPIYLLKSSYHPTDTAGFKKMNIPFQLYYVGPTGHYPMIENANEFNLRLEQVIHVIGNKQ